MPQSLRRRLSLGLAARCLAALLPASAVVAQAQAPAAASQPATSAVAVSPGTKARLAALKPKDFPTRPIELTVAYGPGGGMDVHTRLLAKYLTAYTDQNFLVVNKVGASGLIGHTFIASQARNDGYTLGVLSSNFWADSIQRAEGKWSYKDIDPVAFYNAEPLGWVVLTTGPHGKSSLADLVATARNRPGELTAAMSEGSPTSYLLVQVQKASGTRFNPVPFQGGKQAITNLLGGHIDVSYGYLGEYQALMKEGRLRPIAFTAARRTTVLPDIPTFNELLGTSDILWDAFRFVAAPKGVPADRKAWLEAIMQAVIADPALKTEVEARGGSIDPTLDTPAKLAQEIERRVNSERVYYDTKAGISR